MVAAATGLFSFVPTSLRSSIVSKATGQSAAHARITSDNLAGAGVVWNALTMAHTEMRLIRQVNADALKDNASRIVCFYGQVDGWVPREHSEIMTKNYPEGIPAVRKSLCFTNAPVVC